tara:strand:- start:40 stop:324 length:285 start_codon:yes stop_codon:yes gene_type:complete
MKKIIVICDDVWSNISDTASDTAVWTITDDGFKKLCGEFEEIESDEYTHNVSSPNNLDDRDIIKIQGLHEYVDCTPRTLNALDLFMTEEKKSVS